MGCATMAEPLNSLNLKNGKFLRSLELEKAFVELKQKLWEPKVLKHPDFENSFITEIDATEHSIRAVLSQRDGDGTLHPVQFACRTMNDAGRSYVVCWKETMAVVFAISNPSSLHIFELITDHQALKTAFKKKHVHNCSAL